MDNDLPGAKEPKDHRFLDEAGDTTFYGKNRRIIIGQEGVSMSFAIGMAKINVDIISVRNKIMELQIEVSADSYLNVIPSIRKRMEKGGFFLPRNRRPTRGKASFLQIY